MTINAGYLQYRLSGGGANADPNASLGGVKSTTIIGSQTLTGVTLTGVTAAYAAGNNEGTGVLTYVAATHMLSWTSPGGAAGPAVAVGADGRYALFGFNDVGLVVVDIVAASLPGGDTVNGGITVANVLNLLWDDVSKDDSFNGDTEYRCLYLHNTHGSENFLALQIFVGTQPNPGTIQIGLDPAGVGNGTTTGVATTVANENTAPAGVVFSAPVTEGTGLVVAALNAGQSIALWIKRIIAPLNTVQNPETLALVNVQAYF